MDGKLVKQELKDEVRSLVKKARLAVELGQIVKDLKKSENIQYFTNRVAKEVVDKLDSAMNLGSLKQKLIADLLQSFAARERSDYIIRLLRKSKVPLVSLSNDPSLLSLLVTDWALKRLGAVIGRNRYRGITKKISEAAEHASYRGIEEYNR